MSARTNILRIIPRRGTSSSSPQHTSSPFRLSPSISNNNNQSSFIINSITSTRTLSRRTITSTIRTQTNQSTLRAALSNEISSLRYTLLLESEGEDSLLRGWDAGVVDDDEDGTWVMYYNFVWVDILLIMLRQVFYFCDGTLTLLYVYSPSTCS